jgi:hypothetical protein
VSEKVYAATSGEYSSYTVHCLFAQEEDCREYVVIQNRIWARSSHGYHHMGEFETCSKWPCKGFRESPDTSPEYVVESFDFYGPGIVPVVDE